MKYDVVIAGGGPAGSVAGIAAARGGAKALVIEKHNALGGNMTSGLLGFLGPYDNARRAPDDFQRWRLYTEGKPYPPELRNGERIIKGIPEEFLNRLLECKMAESAEFGYIPVNPEAVKLLLDDMVADAGGNVLYHSLVVDAAYLDDGRIELVVANKAGLTKVTADRVIDCSGDGDVAARLGCDYDMGRAGDGSVQGVTLVFMIGGITADYPDLLPETSLKYSSLAKKAYENGEFSIDPKGVGCPNYIPGMPGVMMVNLQHCFDIDGTNPQDVSYATIEGRRQIQEHVRFFRKYVPGFENCYLIATASQLGIRETRRIIGEYTLTKEDVLGCARFPDGICRFSYDLDVHLPDNSPDIEGQAPAAGDWYDIPYRSLIPKGRDNLLVAGRCISTDHYALSSMRLMSCCMAIGQAAGSAAAMSLDQDISPRLLDASQLRSRLAADGALV